jgi:hypothetical protein
MSDEEQPHSRVVEQIIRKQGGVPTGHRTDGGNDPQAYQAALMTEGWPQMGFSVFLRSGERHAFFYHNIENLDLKEKDKGSYVTLSHRGKTLVMRGENLHEMFQGIMEHTLQAVYEFIPEVYPDPENGAPIVDRIFVQEMSAGSTENANDN